AFSTFEHLHPSASPDDLSASLAAFQEHYYPNNDANLFLEPLTDTYLRSELGNALGGTGSAQLMQIFLLVAIFIMAIAWINYINLTTARATERAKEVGIRKVVGSSRSHLIRQFLLEALLFNVVSAILALTIFQLSLPITSQLLGKDIQTVYLFGEPLFWLLFMIALIIGSIISGLYPAFVLSACEPTTVLKGKFSSSRQGTLLRKGLMVLQFAASIALVGGTYVVFQQLSFMRSQNLGLAIEETMIVESPAIVDENAEDRFTSMKTELSRFQFVESVVFSGNVPGKSYNYSTQAALPDEDLNEASSFAILEVDAQYIPEYQISMVAGRNYSDSLSQENQRVLLNETAAQSLGFETSQAAVGQLIKVGNAETPQEVIGVVADYHHKSLQNPYEPIIFNFRPGSGKISIKLNTTSSSASVADMTKEIKDVYLALFPGNPFDYYFLDDQFNSLYQEDRRIGRLFAIFAILAVLVACLGLFGLTTFTVAQKTKEVGIRKVLGASIVSVLRLLSRDFAVLMLIAVIITLPVIFWAMKQWLTNYAFSIDYSISLFILPMSLVVLVGLITVSTQTVRAALANPVDSLRYE
ncbi:MAG: FtsX-like permease family protein, partial [Cyclobacteriaceae bacterium]